jgi:hypothetical protein
VKNFQCTNCGQIVFFENTQCQQCSSALGYLPEERTMAAFEVQSDSQWLRIGEPSIAYRPCRNYVMEDVCNWMLPAYRAGELCDSCRFTEIIPSLTKLENRRYWFLLEQAKRRLFYTLLELALPMRDRHEDPQGGLSFRFLEDLDPKRRILTGHAHGVITLNIAEADDVKRVAIRTDMGEPYRTMLGHFRHEVGHYYWDQLIANGAQLAEFRALFGDETRDYAAALQTHYYNGPPADWAQSFISAYAASHPWEDWAETWAHYLHMIAALATAESWGFALRPVRPQTSPAVVSKVNAKSASFDRLLYEQWLPLAQFLNSMSRSLGHSDSYPFMMPQPVIDKLSFVHETIHAVTDSASTRPPERSFQASSQAIAAGA